MKFGIDFELDLDKAEKQMKTFLNRVNRQAKIESVLGGEELKRSETFKRNMLSAFSAIKKEIPSLTESQYSAFKKTQEVIKRVVVKEFAGVDPRSGTARYRDVERFRTGLNKRLYGNATNEAEMLKIYMDRQEKARSLLTFRASLRENDKLRSFPEAFQDDKGNFDWASVAAHRAEQLDTERKITEEKQKQYELQSRTYSGRFKSLFRPHSPYARMGRPPEEDSGPPRSSRGGIVGSENYDPNSFSVRKLLRSFGVVAAGYLSVRSFSQLASDAFQAGAEREKSMFNNSVAFGSRKTADRYFMSALNTPFEATDVMSGMRSLQNVGVSAQGSKSLISNMSGRLGQSYSETANDIVAAIGGDYTVLQKYGLKQQDLMPLRSLEGNTPRMRAAVMNLLNRGDIKKQFENGLLDFQSTWEGVTQKLSNQRRTIWYSLIGDPNDKNSLYGVFKGTFVKLSKWIDDNQDKISRFTRTVSKLLTWTWTKVEAVASRIGKAFTNLLNTYWGTEKQFERFTKRVLLGAELVWQKTKWLFDNMPFTSLLAILTGAEFLRKMQQAGYLSGGAFAKGLAKGVLALLSLKELQDLAGQYFSGAYGDENAMKAAIAGDSKQFREQLFQKQGFKDWIMDAPALTEKGRTEYQNKIASQLLKDSKPGTLEYKALQAVLQEDLKNKEKKAAEDKALSDAIYGKPQIVINIQGGLVTKDAINQLGKTILEQQQYLNSLNNKRGANK